MVGTKIISLSGKKKIFAKKQTLLRINVCFLYRYCIFYLSKCRGGWAAADGAEKAVCLHPGGGGQAHYADDITFTSLPSSWLRSSWRQALRRPSWRQAWLLPSWHTACA